MATGDGEYNRARRVVRGHWRDDPGGWKHVDDVWQALRSRGISRPEETFEQLRQENDLVVRGSDLTDYPRRKVYHHGVVAPRTPRYDDITVTVLPGNSGNMATTRLLYKGSFHESQPYHLRVTDCADVRRYLAWSTAPELPGVDVQACIDALRAGLVGLDGELVGVWQAALDGARHLRVQLVAGGELAVLPWELAGHPLKAGELLDDDRVALTRPVDVTVPVVESPAWLDQPVVEYACLNPSRDCLKELEQIWPATGWPTIRTVGDLLGDPQPAQTGGILHIVGHDDGSAGHIGMREQIVAAIAARRPRLAVVALCHSADDQVNGDVPWCVARAVAASGVPSVIGVSGQIEGKDHVTFSGKFYESLAESYCEETALRLGRGVLHTLRRVHFVHFRHRGP